MSTIIEFAPTDPRRRKCEWRARLLMPAALSIAILAAHASASDPQVLRFDEGSRTWSTASGEHSTSAALISYASRTVTLQTDAGKTVTLSVDRLSDTDRVYLGRRIRLAKSRIARQAASELPKQEESQPNRPMQLASLNTQKANAQAADSPAPESEQLYGIDWYDASDAEAIAKSEQKPILWFRVLGDLTGFM